MPVGRAEIAAGREYAAAVRAANAPAEANAIISWLVRVHYLTLPPKDSSPDENKLRFAALAEELRAWPGEAVRNVLAEWPRVSRFFPLLAEMKEKLDEATFPVRFHLRQVDELLDAWEGAAEGGR
ncbi:MAG TPA: hypothetical protein DCW68_02710 [Rhodospirillaceae bacterium]|nr:MAG: hypothetical protein A2018_05685 [Alphaproteobacteria bacterium GWF2_58_20]HAU29006.1 hypothetical protein [Rhodospirillaceae bacterium]